MPNAWPLETGNVISSLLQMIQGDRDNIWIGGRIISILHEGVYSDRRIENRRALIVIILEY